MKGFFAIYWALPLLLALSMGCARDRDARSLFSSPVTFNRDRVATRTEPMPSIAEKKVVQHKLCPVTGEPLDSMGGSIPVVANDQTIFVCCQGCVKSVKQDPAKHLAIALAE